MSIASTLRMLEHAHYPFKSYPRKKCDTILFPGCSFPSQFPKTMDALADLVVNAGFGIAYDCCGSPLEGFGLDEKAERVMGKLADRLASLNCKRLVCACPNCEHYLRGRLDVEVLSIFDVLDKLGIDEDRDVESARRFGRGHLFIPCPDRDSHKLETKLRLSCNLDCVATLDHAPCCGLRPDLARCGDDYSEKLGKKVIEQAQGKPLYTYCASCLGHFSRLGYHGGRHVLSVLLGIDEAADSKHALSNRAKRTFDRNTNPAWEVISQ